MGAFLLVQGEKAFTKEIKYTDEYGNYNCTETYKFGKNTSAKCDVPTGATN